MLQLHRALRAALVPLLLLAACANEAPSTSDPPANTSLGSGQPHGTRGLSRPLAAVPALVDFDAVFRETGIPDTQIGREIYAYLLASEQPPAQGGTAQMEAAMRPLDQHRRDVVAALVDAYNHLDETAYVARMNIVYLLGRIRDVSSIAALETIARAEIPPERYAPQTEGGSQEREFDIRSSAIQTIGILDLENRDAISQSLRALTGSSLHRGLRAIAVRGYLDAGDFAQRRAELSRVLPPQDHWMLAR